MKHIENGFYIDIGAQDPVTDSVSRAFYENGWRGVHAEATTYYADKVRQNRPDELVVQAAIGAGEGSLRFFEIPETGLSTSNRDIAAKHQASGHRVVETEVPLVPLSVVLSQGGDRDIHWLKIDVEGMEQSVIESWQPSKARPWIVVVESTLPNSQIAAHDAWEPTLLKLGYTFAYFDGLSRFYVSEQHPEFLPFFGPGPNVFDNFVLAENSGFATPLRSLLAERDRQLEGVRAEQVQLRQDIQLRDERLGILEGALSNTRDREAQLSAELREIYHSLSWRLTGPLREINVLKAKLVSLPRQFVRVLLEKVIRWLSKNQEWKGRALRELHRFPRLRGKLEAFARSRGYGVTSYGTDIDGEAKWYIDAPKDFSAQWKQLLENTPPKIER
nr:FkbM family methyltransferase [Rhizobium sp. BK602]